MSHAIGHSGGPDDALRIRMIRIMGPRTSRKNRPVIPHREIPDRRNLPQNPYREKYGRFLEEVTRDLGEERRVGDGAFFSFSSVMR